MSRAKRVQKNANDHTDGIAPPSIGARLLPLLIVVAGLFAYANSFSGAFLFDDAPHIVQNNRIRTIFPLSTTLSGHRPLTDLTLAINFATGQLNVRGYHAVNLAIHIFAALTLYGLVRRTLSTEILHKRFGKNPTWIAMSVALLWITHPLQTQSVTYLIQRSEALMGMMYLLTLYAVLRGASSNRSWQWYLLAVVCCAMGMASKAVMVTAPVTVLLFDRTFLAGSFYEAIKRRWRLYAGLFATWSVVFLIGIAGSILDPTPRAGAHVGFGYRGIAPLEYLQTQFGVLVHYLKISVWPYSLCLDYDWPVAKTAWQIVPPAIIIAGLLLATLWALIRRPALGFLGATFFLILSPTSSFVPIKDPLFEHRMYLPLASCLMLIVIAVHTGLQQWAKRKPATNPSTRTIATALTLIATLALGAATIQRNQFYHDPVTMWQDVTQKRPQNARAFENLGTTLMAKGKSGGSVNTFEQAIDAYSEAVRLDADFASAHANLGNVLSELGRFDQAKGHYRDAIRLEPQYVAAYINLAHALEQLGQDSERIETLQAAIRIESRPDQYRDLARANLNLGSALGNRGDITSAIAHYRQALRIWPEYAAAHFWLGIGLQRTGETAEAKDHFQTTLRLDPNHPGARKALQSLQRPKP